jgi:hypothetical protein
MVPMDRARWDWVYEHAETGRPCRPSDRNRPPGVAGSYPGDEKFKSLGLPIRLLVRTLKGLRWHFRKSVPLFRRAEPPCEQTGSNGPAGLAAGACLRHRLHVGDSRTDGQNRSAFGSLQPGAGAASLFWAARAEGISQTSIRFSAHSDPCRKCAPLSNRAECTRGVLPQDGKARWQRKFAFRARRMKRGLQF